MIKPKQNKAENFNFSNIGFLHLKMRYRSNFYGMNFPSKKTITSEIENTISIPNLSF